MEITTDAKELWKGISEVRSRTPRAKIIAPHAVAIAPGKSNITIYRNNNESYCEVTVPAQVEGEGGDFAIGDPQPLSFCDGQILLETGLDVEYDDGVRSGSLPFDQVEFTRQKPPANKQFKPLPVHLSAITWMALERQKTDKDYIMFSGKLAEVNLGVGRGSVVGSINFEPVVLQASSLGRLPDDAQIAFVDKKAWLGYDNVFYMLPVVNLDYNGNMGREAIEERDVIGRTTVERQTLKNSLGYAKYYNDPNFENGLAILASENGKLTVETARFEIGQGLVEIEVLDKEGEFDIPFIPGQIYKVVDNLVSNEIVMKQIDMGNGGCALLFEDEDILVGFAQTNDEWRNKIKHSVNMSGSVMDKGENNDK